MVSWQIHTKIAIAIFCGALSVSAQAANSYSYLFSQGGYNQGGMVVGTFSGTDYNGDGKLVFFVDSDDQEITSYSMVFSGGAVVPAFSHSLTNLYGLVYNIGSPFLGDESYPDHLTHNTEGLESSHYYHPSLPSLYSSSFFYASGLGPNSRGYPTFTGYSGPTEPIGGLIIHPSTGNATFSNMAISVSPVPETETWVMMLAGLALVGRIVRRRKGLVTPG